MKDSPKTNPAPRQACRGRRDEETTRHCARATNFITPLKPHNIFYRICSPVSRAAKERSHCCDCFLWSMVWMVANKECGPSDLPTSTSMGFRRDYGWRSSARSAQNLESDLSKSLRLE